MPLLDDNSVFTGRPEIYNFAGILLDMDGTIVDSTDAIVKHWHKYEYILLGSARHTMYMVHVSSLYEE